MSGGTTGLQGVIEEGVVGQSVLVGDGLDDLLCQHAHDNGADRAELSKEQI